MNEATRKRGLICYIIFCSLQFLLGKLTWKELLASLQIISTGIYGTVRNWVQNSKWRDKISSKLTRYQYLTFWLTSFVCMTSEENNPLSYRIWQISWSSWRGTSIIWRWTDPVKQEEWLLIEELFILIRQGRGI